MRVPQPFLSQFNLCCIWLLLLLLLLLVKHTYTQAVRCYCT